MTLNGRNMDDKKILESIDKSLKSIDRSLRILSERESNGNVIETKKPSYHDKYFGKAEKTVE